MTTTAITAATGQLGRLVLDALLARGVPATDLVAAVRDPAKATDLAALGVQVRHADYTQPDTLRTAFSGVDQVLLISSPEAGARLTQHRNAVEAAQAAGVGRLVYTSILHAHGTKVGLAAEHEATEDLITASGLPHAFLRNGWYTENYTSQVATQVQHGAILGATAGAGVGLATRRDYAEAAAAVLTDPTATGAYELAGPDVTLAAYAAEVARQSGKQVTSVDLSQADYEQALLGAGLPAPVAAMLADADAGIARGDLSDASGTLERLLGRPATPLADAVSAALTG